MLSWVFDKLPTLLKLKRRIGFEPFSKNLQYYLSHWTKWGLNFRTKFFWRAKHCWNLVQIDKFFSFKMFDFTLIFAKFFVKIRTYFVQCSNPTWRLSHYITWSQVPMLINQYQKHPHSCTPIDRRLPISKTLNIYIWLAQSYPRNMHEKGPLKNKEATNQWNQL